MSCQWRALLTVLNLLAAFVRSNAVWVKGTKYIPANSAVFIAKYCFDFDPTANNTGEVDFLLKRVSPAKGDMKIVLLNDQMDSYPDSTSRWPGYDCGDDRLNKAAKAQLSVDTNDMSRTNRLHTFIVEKLRPRFWFIAALDCSGIDRTIDYEVHLLNIEQGWLKELSMDHCGIPSLVLFLLVYLGTALLQVHAIFMQSTAKTKHVLRLLLTFGICSALWGMGFYTFDTIVYAARGDDTFLLYLAAKLFKAGSKFTLWLILLLLSRGRCISTELHLRDLIHGALVICPFLIVCLCLEVWSEYDQASKYTTNFVYNTWVGGVLVCADLVLFGLYVSNLRRTYAEESAVEKKAFYRTWGSVYSAAFLTLPVSLVVALSIATHVRVSVMFWFHNAVHALLLELLVIGLWPERTQEVFNIDKGGCAASVFGAQAGDEELLKAKGSEYQEFNMEDSI